MALRPPKFSLRIVQHRRLNHSKKSYGGGTWLVRIKDQPRRVEVLSEEQIGCVNSDVATIISDSIEAVITQITILPDWHNHNSEVSLRREVYVGEAHSPPITRRSSRLKKHKSGAQRPLKPKSTLEQPISGNDEPLEPIEASSKSSNFNQVEVQPITSWIGNQLKDQTIPQSALNGVIETHENYPDGLLAIPFNSGGPPRIIVPLTAQENLVKQAHLDIHHQNHRNVYNLLYPLYWWPNMGRDIEKICNM
jgi:hypothetical protein